MAHGGPQRCLANGAEPEGSSLLTGRCRSPSRNSTLGFSNFNSSNSNRETFMPLSYAGCRTCRARAFPADQVLPPGRRLPLHFSPVNDVQEARLAEKLTRIERQLATIAAAVQQLTR